MTLPCPPVASAAVATLTHPAPSGAAVDPPVLPSRITSATRVGPQQQGALMKVAIFGLGYVGTVTAAGLASQGHDVVGVDVDWSKVDAINAGQSPVVEPGVDRMVAQAVCAGRLRATTDVREAMEQAEVSLVCVGTPSTPRGDTNLPTSPGRSRTCGGSHGRRPHPLHPASTRSSSAPRCRPEPGPRSSSRHSHPISCRRDGRWARPCARSSSVKGAGSRTSSLHRSSSWAPRTRARGRPARTCSTSSTRRSEHVDVRHRRGAEVRVQRLPRRQGDLRQRDGARLLAVRRRLARRHAAVLRGPQAQHLARVPAAGLRVRRLLPPQGPAGAAEHGPGEWRRRAPAELDPGAATRSSCAPSSTECWSPATAASHCWGSASSRTPTTCARARTSSSRSGSSARGSRSASTTRSSTRRSSSGPTWSTCRASCPHVSRLLVDRPEHALEDAEVVIMALRDPRVAGRPARSPAEAGPRHRRATRGGRRAPRRVPGCELVSRPRRRSPGPTTGRHHRPEPPGALRPEGLAGVPDPRRARVRRHRRLPAGRGHRPVPGRRRRADPRLPRRTPPVAAGSATSSSTPGRSSRRRGWCAGARRGRPLRRAAGLQPARHLLADRAVAARLATARGSCSTTTTCARSSTSPGSRARRGAPYTGLLFLERQTFRAADRVTSTNESYAAVALVSRGQAGRPT